MNIFVYHNGKNLPIYNFKTVLCTMNDMKFIKQCPGSDRLTLQGFLVVLVISDKGQTTNSQTECLTDLRRLGD